MKIKSSFSALLSAAALTLTLVTPVYAAAVFGQGTWESTLQARDLDGNGSSDAFYDTTLNITWLRNANVDGLMTWDAAVAWAAGYSIGGYSGWRLPAIVDTGTSGCTYSDAGGTDCGFNVQTTSGRTVFSEMASLWYDTLGNKAYYAPVTGNGPQTGWGLTNTGDFLNLQSYYYWSGLGYAPYSDVAWFFQSNVGGQDAHGKAHQFYALAVRPGDVLAAPEPGTLVLAALALVGLGLIRRRALGASGL